MKSLNVPLPPAVSRSRTRTTVVRASGFTLVELLTVIAIIAILTAIILPVFGLVRENTRRTASASNMSNIYGALKQYELDNRRYPDFLYGPAIKSNGSGGCAIGTGAAAGLLVIAAAGDTPCTMEQVAQTGKAGGKYAQSNGTAVSSFYGALYPEYVKDLNVFHAPNNTIADTTTDTQIASVSRYVPKTPSTSPVQENVTYYKYDSYDANQAINTDGTPNPGAWKLRYTRQWTPLVDKTDATFNTPAYKNQLVFGTPSTDTAVTMDTYSVSKGKIIVLWLSGAPKVLDVNKLKNNSSLAGTNGNDFNYYLLGPNQ